jgi:oligosaccharide repeat unit polymerase
MNKKLKILIYNFIFVNIFAIAMVAIIPFIELSGQYAEYISLNLSFLLIVSAVGVFTFYLLKALITAKKPKFPTMISNEEIYFTVKVIVFLTLVGLVCLLIDRLIIRDIDYSLGSRTARYQWLTSQGGNFFSIIGNLFSPFAYCGIFFLMIHSSKIKDKWVYFTLASIILSIFGFSFLNGARSNLLLALVVGYISIILKEKKIEDKNQKLSVKNKSLILFIFLLTIYYVTDATSQSASMGAGGWDVQTLILMDIQNFNIVPVNEFFDLNASREWIFNVIYILIYLYHGQWSAMYALSMPSSSREGSFLLYPYQTMLDRIGLVGSYDISYFTDLGVFISLPGAFYYDLGWIGVIVLSTLLGVFLGLIAYSIFRRNSVDGIKLSLIIYILSILVLSPVLPAYGFGGLDFIVFSFFCLGLLNLIRFKKRSNWI